MGGNGLKGCNETGYKNLTEGATVHRSAAGGGASCDSCCQTGLPIRFSLSVLGLKYIQQSNGIDNQVCIRIGGNVV